MRRRSLSTFVSLLACALPRAASADERPASAELHYSVGPGADTCASPDAIRAAIVKRLGYDPFDPRADKVVDAAIRREGGRYVASVSITMSDGSVRAREPLTSSASDCTEISSTLALAISIAIDPMTFLRPEPPPPPPPEAPPPPPAPADKAERPPPKRSLGLEVGGGAMGSVGALPAPSVAPVVVFGLVTDRLRFDAEGRYDVPVSAGGPSGSAVRGALALGTLAGCYVPRPISFCALGSIGSLLGAGSGVVNRADDAVLYAAVGLRAGLELPSDGIFRARLQLDGYAPARSTTLRIVGSDVWTSPPVFATLSVVMLVLPR